MIWQGRFHDAAREEAEQMFASNIRIAEKYDYLEEKFRKAYQWLRDNDPTKMECGRYDIDGDNVYAMVQSYDTQPEENRRFETHEKYFDIQYVAEGIEKFGVRTVEGLVVQERKPDNDVIFYEKTDSAGWLILNPGELAVVAPEDAHCPQCMAGDTPCKVRKVVIKVRV